MNQEQVAQEWTVTYDGAKCHLALSNEGLSLTQIGSEDARMFVWASLSQIAFPTGFNAQLTTSAGETATFGFASGALKRDPRLARG